MGLPLTQIDPELERKVSVTIPGMAHWSGSGPVGAQCGHCKFFVSIKRGLGNSTRCEKYASMMNGNYGPKKLPSETRACKYFEHLQA